MQTAVQAGTCSAAAFLVLLSGMDWKSSQGVPSGGQYSPTFVVGTSQILFNFAVVVEAFWPCNKLNPSLI